MRIRLFRFLLSALPAVFAILLATEASAFVVGTINRRSGIWVENTGTSATDITIKAYDTAGNLKLTFTDPTALQAGESRDYRLSRAEFSTLGDFKGSIVASSSSQAIQVTSAVFGSENGNPFAFADGYSGLESNAAQELPLVMKNNFGLNTILHVQNRGSGYQTLTVSYGNGSVVETFPNVPPYTTIHVDNSTDANLPSSYVGGAQVWSTGNSGVAVAVEQVVSNSTSFRSLASYIAADGGASVDLPLIMASHFGFTTSIGVYNESSTGTFTVTYHSNGTYSFNPTPEVYNIGAGGFVAVPLSGGQWVGHSFLGTADITSNNRNISAIVNQTCRKGQAACPNNTIMSAYTGANDTVWTSTTINIPLIVAGDHYYTSEAIENVDPNGSQVGNLCTAKLSFGPNQAGTWAPDNTDSALTSPQLGYHDVWLPNQSSATAANPWSTSDTSHIYVGNAKLTKVSGNCRFLVVENLQNVDNIGEQFISFNVLPNSSTQQFLPVAYRDSTFTSKGVGQPAGGGATTASAQKTGDWWFDWGFPATSPSPFSDAGYIPTVYAVSNNSGIASTISTNGFPASNSWLIYNEPDEHVQANATAIAAADGYVAARKILADTYAASSKPLPYIVIGGMEHLPVSSNGSFTVSNPLGGSNPPVTYTNGISYWNAFLGRIPITATFDAIHFHAYAYSESCTNNTSATSVTCLTNHLNDAYDYFHTTGPYSSVTGNKDLWLTEVGLIGASPVPSAAEVAISVTNPIMNWFYTGSVLSGGGRPNIKRMAWFSTAYSSWTYGNLIDTSTQGLTPVGKMWGSPLDW